ncbi:sulfite oxidase heme-binding subunit YedZ [Kistimonas asteriae]|uniref:sulfite oxidase heme-binding subunit YedZ n=1 Tax=Kistimonas asteriae TaxID=517724 RepID=UPI001BA9D8B3|nr:protein-methionine-sulfoxide reductase heme-binding subunit MsrQ [Kistimonas asteriae]
MTVKRWVTVSKIPVFLLCLWPLGWVVTAAYQNTLGPDPAKAIVLFMGIWALRFLCITLAVTPLKRILKFSQLLRFRRMLGLYALFYAVLHVAAYFFFLLNLDVAELYQDLFKRPYILVGAMALILLIALGVTSPRAVMKRMGKNWQKLHRMIYVSVLLVLLHYLWLSKSGYGEPLLYVLIVVALLGYRLIPHINPLVRAFVSGRAVDKDG